MWQLIIVQYNTKTRIQKWVTDSSYVVSFCLFLRSLFKKPVTIMPSKFIAKSITAFVVHVGLIDIIAITTYDILGTWDDGSRLTNAGL